ncbi:MAG: formylglycine-generating enzyme family protein [Anaerolineaceae bacterium]|nr:formylglycine-generating enzyme family protein [Anaerolineaceae bacterium]
MMLKQKSLNCLDFDNRLFSLKHVFGLFLLLNLLVQPSVAFAENTVETTARKVGATFRDCPNCPEMVVVPAGGFLMGVSDSDIQRAMRELPDHDKKPPMSFIFRSPAQYMVQATPQHNVRIAHSFGVGKFPVTYAEFAAFVQETGYRATQSCSIFRGQASAHIEGNWQYVGFAQTVRDPVVCVNSGDAEVYIAWLNLKTKSASNGARYRLPSEAEYEYAARAGTTDAYWWGESIGLGHAVCQECGSVWDNTKTAPVGSFPPNPFGLYDIPGNIAELTADCWNDSYAGAPTDGSAWATGDCKWRAARGGGWNAPAQLLWSSFRSDMPAKGSSNDVGFRVVRELP